MIGPGKYDEAATMAREQTQAEAVILFVFNGQHGTGFSFQLSNPAHYVKLPLALRYMADQIEEDFKRIAQGQEPRY